MSLTAAQAQVSGTVFRDYNGDGVRSSSVVTGITCETAGVENVRVRVTDAGGTTQTALTDASGNYTVTGLSGPVRVEFSTPAGDFPTFVGTNTQTAERFVTAPATNVDFGVQYPYDYCQNNPSITVSCYESGLAATNTNKSIVSFNYDYVAFGPASTGNANINEVGSTWGGAYQRDTRTMFYANVLKRHTGIGPAGMGGVYVIDFASGSLTGTYSSSFTLQGTTPANGGPAIDLGSIDRTSGPDYTLPASATLASVDLDAFGKAAKVGYGDIDFTEDGKQLWLVNLNQQALISVDMVGNVPGTTKQYALTAMAGVPACGTLSGTAVGSIRPWALTFYRGKGYVGMICDGVSANTTLTRAQRRPFMSAYVMEFDPANPTTLTQVLSFSLGYTREVDGFRPNTDLWQPWIDVPATLFNVAPTAVYYPQPILSDIEFTRDGKSIEMMLMDRWGLMGGENQNPPLAGSTQLGWSFRSHGDIVHACLVNGTYVIEGAAGCPTNDAQSLTPAPSDPATIKKNDGPSNNGEFFWADFFKKPDPNATDHSEISVGALAYKPGMKDVVGTVYDPNNNTQATDTQGVRWFSLETGNAPRGYQVVGSSGTRRTFGKGNGLGDMELRCDVAPIMIGNRVWIDTDDDGVQDPGEPVASNVPVRLQGPGLPTGGVTVNTDANGNYYFTSATSTTATPSHILGSLSLVNGGAYTLTFPTSYSTYALSTKANQTTDNIDSDPSAAGTLSFTLGQAGQNNFTYDAAYTTCPLPTIQSLVITPATCGADGRPNNDAKVSITGTNIVRANVSRFSSTSYAANLVGHSFNSSPTSTTFALENLTYPATAWVRVWSSATCFKDTSFAMPATPTCPLPTACTGAAGEIGGNVFRDYNNNGTRDANEAFYGVSNVEVKAYDCDGNLLGTTTTDQYGNYHFTGMPSTTVRIEFGNLPAGVKPSAVGTDNGSSTQFLTAPNCTADYGVNDPAEYCQDDPLVSVPCYVAGSGSGPDEGHVLVTFPYSYANDTDGNTSGGITSFPSRTTALAPTAIAENSQIGTVYGLAYNPLNETLYEGAFVKRKTQLGPLGNESTGAIYQIKPKDATPPSVFADLNVLFGAGTAGANPHPIGAPTTDFNDDLVTTASVYKAGLGDVEISADFKKLYVVNMFDRTVYVLPTDQTATATNVEKLPLTLTGLPTLTGTCATADVRPFGLGKDKQGAIYLGGACSAQSTQDRRDMALYVWKLTGSTWNLVFKTDSLIGVNGYNQPRWYPWKDTHADDVGTSSSGSQYPQAIVSDIEFDGDDMILGVRDRFGDLVPRAFGLPGGAPFPRTNGDILRACVGGPLGYVLETNAVCGNKATNGYSTIDVTRNGIGSARTEYYYGDIPGDRGIEASNGALLTIPGRGEVMSSAYDPVPFLSDGTRPGNNFNTGGVQKYSHHSGNIVGAYDVYLVNDLNTFGKASGVGDIEALCDIQPIEVGNRLWIDADGDGVQDPCEIPIAGVTVGLYDNAGTLVATTTTDASGNYYFNQTNVVDTVGTAKRNLLGPQPSTNYFIVVGKEDGAFNPTTGQLTLGNQPPMILTTPNSTQNNGNDQNDSDAQTSRLAGLPATLAGYPVIAATTPVSGADHTFDAGFVPPASIGDYAFIDTDRNGTQSVGDTPLPGVMVTLFQNGSAVATTTTNAAGAYSFTGLVAGSANSYEVGFVPPASLSLTTTTANVGSNTALDSDVLATGRTAAFTLTSGESRTTVDAGYVAPLAPLPLLSKRVSVSRAELGSVVSYTLAMANPAGVASASTTVSDTFGAGIELVAGSLVASVGTGSPTGSGLSWAVPSLPASSTATLTFSASLTQEGIAYNTATVVTPDRPEGQTVTVCTTVPIRVCAGLPFQFDLSVPANSGPYQWSLNGQPIPGATGNVLSATQVGEYTVATSGTATCPTGSCCPFVIEERPLPSLTAVAVSASCVGATPQSNAAITLVGSSTNAVSYNITLGSSFTAATPLFTSPQPLSAVVNGVLLGSLPNPATPTDYTIRVYSVDGCFSDVVVRLQPTVCNCPPPRCVPFQVRRIVR